MDYVLLNNFKHIKENEFQEIKFEFFEKYVNAKDVFTQFDMAMVQSAFFASLVVFPKLYGVETVPKWVSKHFLSKKYKKKLFVK